MHLSRQQQIRWKAERNAQLTAEDKHYASELKKLNGASAGSGAYGWFPLAVCAQALVVCAVLFYAIAGGGGGKRKSSSHLP